MEQQFCSRFASWFAAETGHSVSVAEEGIIPQEKQIYVARGDKNLMIGPRLSFQYVIDDSISWCPSVDVFFQSLAKNWPNTGCAAVLTGMGQDGAVGLGSFRKKGWKTFAQDQASSTIYGMPKIAYERGAAENSLSALDIASSINQWLHSQYS